jgi:hypothetical protein
LLWLIDLPKVFTMTAVRIPRLSRPGVLESIAPERLFALLHPFADFFAGQSAPITSPNSIDCQAVIRAITQSDRDTPADLLDAICLIDDMAKTSAVDLLLERVPGDSIGLERGGKHSKADIVTAAWLSARERLLQIHALSRIKRVRSFDYFQANQTTAPKFVTPTQESLQQLERDIDSWHVERFRAQGTKVEIFENADEVEFSIMHGSLYRRQPVVENGQFGIQSFWPLQSASAIYNREFGELRINAKTPGEKALYCRLLGKHMFGDEKLFPTVSKYTLDPLREFGFEALTTRDIDGVLDVRMVELWLGDPDERYGVLTIRKGGDLLDWAEAKQKNIKLERRLISATFKMVLLLQGRKSEWSITIRPPNVAIYSRGIVSLIIEAWLTQRGFIIPKHAPRTSQDVPALASPRKAG